MHQAMTNFQPTMQTIVLIAAFTLLYLVGLVRQTVRGRLDFYDLAMLSMVALLPSLFVFLPQLADLLGRFAGVAFPFLVMFGALFLVVFFVLHRMTIEMHKSQKSNRLLIQELSLLKSELERIRPRP